MFVVLVHLDGAALSLPQLNGNLALISAGDVWKLSVEAITIVGVNGFTLISGYFGIHASVRGFLKFTFICLFYAVGLYTAYGLYHHFALGQPFPWHQWAESWLVYTHTDLWYVPAYLGLYLISPFINASIWALSKRKLAVATGAFVIFNVWAGWWWSGSFNPTGYTVIQLVMMYLIGGCIRRYSDGLDIASRRRLLWPAAGVYAASTIVTILLAMYMDPDKAYAYNAPAVIVASGALMVVFVSRRYSNAAVNSVAAAAFSVYLIHKNPLIWGHYIKPLALKMWYANGVLTYTIFAIAFTVAVYAVCWLIDLMRRKIETAFFNHIKINC